MSLFPLFPLSMPGEVWKYRTFADGRGRPLFYAGHTLRHHVVEFQGIQGMMQVLLACLVAAGTIRRNFVTGCAYAEELLYAVVCADGREGGHQWTGQFQVLQKITDRVKTASLKKTFRPG
ncbi:MAG: hypothetical protein ACLR0U_17205 [Enterocloster clostridioformis]